MIGLDTNVLVRFLVRDDPQQFARALRLIRAEAERGQPVFISHLVLMETEWVLRSRYELSKQEIREVFADLLSATDVAFEEEHSVEEALFLWKDSPAQFTDCLIGADYRACACDATASFDGDALKLPGFVAA